MNSLRKVKEKYLWYKLQALRADFFDIYGVLVPIIEDTAIDEFADSIINALLLLGADFEHQTIIEIAYSLLEKLPEGRNFLKQYPLKIIPGNGDTLLTRQWTSVCYREWKDSCRENMIKRTIEILDYTLPNSRGIPAVLFKEKDLVLPFVCREYISSLGNYNEAEILLRMAKIMDNEFTFSLPLVHVKNRIKQKELIKTYLPFLEMYVQSGNIFDSGTGQQISKDDIAMLLRKHFNLSELNEYSLLKAKIALYYIEPLYNIFKITEADQEKLERINEYIESIYGKPFKEEKAREEILAVIEKENEHIKKMNNRLDPDTDILWPLIQKESPKWKKLYNIYMQRLTCRNILNIWELKGILYELNMQEYKKNKHSIIAKLEKWAQKAIRKAVCRYEENHPWFINIRKRIYDNVYEKLDKKEKSLDACGWKEFSDDAQTGGCLRQDRNCCTIPFISSCYTKKICNNKSLTCKIWLCCAAQARLAATRQGRRFLALRRRLSYWCITLNIPLKIRCAKNNAFDDTSKEPSADTAAPDWFNKPMKPAPEKENNIRKIKRWFYKPPKQEIITYVNDDYTKDWLKEPPKKINLKKTRIKHLILGIIFLLLTIYIFIIMN